MATQSHKNDGETDDYTPAARAEAEAERVRGMFRDDGVEDPYVKVLGTRNAWNTPRVFVVLEDLNMAAVDLLKDPLYMIMSVDDGFVELMRTFHLTDD